MVDDKQVAVVPFRLVSSEGRPLPRSSPSILSDSNPFGLTRLYYDIRERVGEEVWVEDAHKRVRWRQSASTVTVQVTLTVLLTLTLTFITITFVTLTFLP